MFLSLLHPAPSTEPTARAEPNVEVIIPYNGRVILRIPVGVTTVSP